MLEDTIITIFTLTLLLPNFFTLLSFFFPFLFHDDNFYAGPGARFNVKTTPISVIHSTVLKSKCSRGGVGISELRAHCYDFLSTSDCSNFIKFTVGIYFCLKKVTAQSGGLIQKTIKFFLFQPFLLPLEVAKMFFEHSPT